MLNIKEANKLEGIKKEMIAEENNKVRNNFNKIKEQNKKPIREVRRAEIWFVDLGENRKGHLQHGTRPFIILSNDLNNKYCSNINGCSITSQLDKTPLPVHVRINGFNLSKESVVLAETIESIDKSQLLSYVGTVDEVTMQRIEKAVRVQLSKLKPKNTFERLNAEKQQYIVNKLNIIKECETVLRFLHRLNGDEKSINLAEDEKFNAENALMTYCYEHSLNHEDFYTAEHGINSEIAL